MNRSKALAFVLGAVVTLGAAGAGGYYLWEKDRHPPRRLVLYGNVDIREVDLAFNVPGRIERMLFDEGDDVARGRLMAGLERDRFVDRVDSVRAALDQQRAVLARLEAGSRPEEIEKARAEVAAAEAALRNARETYERRRALVRTNVVSEQAVDDALEARDRAAANLRAAEQALQLAVKGPRQEDIDAARAEVRRLEAELALAREDLADTEIHAPVEGTVLVRITEPGAVVQAGEPVYTFAVRSPVWVRAYVPEPDLGRIYPGMPVEVTTDSRPHRPYHGQIGFISPTAEFTPKTVQTPDVRTSLVYRFRVIVDNPDRYLRQGMPVTLIIRLDQAGANGAGEPAAK